MASPSTWRWSWKTTRDASLTVSSCCNTPILSFSLYKRNTRRRIHLTKFSLNHNSSSSSSSKSSEIHSSPSTENGILKKKSIQIEKSVDPTSLILINEGSPNLNPDVTTFGEKLKNGSSSIRTSSYFGKKPLWRRIFFASKKVRSIILLNVITIIYASDISVLKEVEAAIMDPAAFTAVRFALSAVPFIPFVFHARGDVQTRAAGIELGFWVSMGYLMQALGLLTSDAGRASFISLFTVIVVPLLDGMLGATVPARTWFGALMSVVGVTMLESSGSPPSVGDLLNFLSAVFFGVHMLRTEHISRSTNKENFLPLLGYEICVVAIFSIIWYFVGDSFSSINGWDPGSWTWTIVWHWMVEFPWVPALYTGVFSTGLCLWVEMAAMRDISATETAIIYGLEPLWGAGFAWCLLGERWGTAGWIGAALVLGGSLSVQILEATTPTKSTEEKENIGQIDHLLVSDKRKSISASPVVVSTRKTDLLK